MMSDRITLLASQERQVLDVFARAEGQESAAVILFRRLHRPVGGLEESDRYVAVAVVPFEEGWVKERSPHHIKFAMAPLRELFRRCREEGLVFGFAHNHPTGMEEFSEADDQNEKTLLEALVHRNGYELHMVSLLWANDGWKARVRAGAAPDQAVPVRHIAILGEGIAMYGYELPSIDEEHDQARAAAAFGQPFTGMLRSLRIGVVGAGGTGSAVITMLARSGIGEMVIIDKDSIARSNLNRLRGAGHPHVERKKAATLKAFIEEYLRLETKVAAIEEMVDNSPAAVDALASCDVIFGCTDDQIGREVLLTSMNFYAQAYIDIGLGGNVAEVKRTPRLINHFGRVSTIMPESGDCLFCQGELSTTAIRYEYALRENPELTEEEAKEKYLAGGGEQAPGVGPFTGAIADFGIISLYDLLNKFHKLPPELKRERYEVDFVKLRIKSNESIRKPECPYCGTHEFLLKKETNRLDRPTLGRVLQHV